MHLLNSCNLCVYYTTIWSCSQQLSITVFGEKIHRKMGIFSQKKKIKRPPGVPVGGCESSLIFCGK
nr:MAG TPA: hypothetical protein [Caudoviricetes sp.]